MCPIEPEAPRDLGLFELWMGLTPEEWDALSENRDDGADPEA
ncbi:hypothetical protein [Sphingomonas oryzagri]